MPTVRYHSCNLCEAMCGTAAVTVEDAVLSGVPVTVSASTTGE